MLRPLLLIGLFLVTIPVGAITFGYIQSHDPAKKGARWNISGRPAPSFTWVQYDLPSHADNNYGSGVDQPNPGNLVVDNREPGTSHDLDSFVNQIISQDGGVAVVHGSRFPLMDTPNPSPTWISHEQTPITGLSSGISGSSAGGGQETADSMGDFNPPYIPPNEVGQGIGAGLNQARPTPIPGAVWLLGSGLVGLIGLRWKPRTYRKPRPLRKVCAG